MRIKIKLNQIIVLCSFVLTFIISFGWITSLHKDEKYELVMSVQEDEILNIMQKMTIEEKIAQMLIIYYNTNTFNDEIRDFVDQVKPGGFILMEGNFSNFDSTKEYISNLKNHSKIPLIISIDQEGGLVQRLKYIKDLKPLDIPDMYDLGSTNNKDLAYQVGKVMAEELRTIGVNVVYAPDIDVYSNPGNTVIGPRSFSSDPKIVSMMANSLANGLEDNKVIATYKHFPGHGDTIIDSHEDLPLINKDYNSLKNLELIPFKEAIKNNAKIIMIGHLALPNITGNNTPATLSKDIINILKNDLNYDGLIITDALNMGALTNYYDPNDLCVQAINAGVDLLLMPGDVNGAINLIKEKVDEDRINESVYKILTFKYKYLSEDNTLPKEYLNSIEHQNIINQIKG